MRLDPARATSEYSHYTTCSSCSSCSCRRQNTQNNTHGQTFDVICYGSIIVIFLYIILQNLIISTKGVSRLKNLKIQF